MDIDSNGVNDVNRTKPYIGRSNWPSDAYFKGKIDELVIYDYIFTLNHRNCIYD